MWTKIAERVTRKQLEIVGQVLLVLWPLIGTIGSIVFWLIAVSYL